MSFAGVGVSTGVVGGGGGIEARPGTEKRCSHNLQSGPVKTWTAVFVIINIPIDDQLIWNSFQNLCVFCRESKRWAANLSWNLLSVSYKRVFDGSDIDGDASVSALSLVCCSGEWISCELYSSHVSLVYTWRTGLRQMFQSWMLQLDNST